MKNFLIFLALSFSLNVYAICPIIRYVTPDGAGVKNGTSWGNAYDRTQLQTAINESGIAQVWVSAGTYTPTSGDDPAISFNMKNGVAIYGGFCGTESSVNERLNFGVGQVNETILSADFRRDNFTNGNGYHVIYNSGVNNTALLDGFTITRGIAEGDLYLHRHGGGIYNTSSSPKIINCTISGNYAIYGGGGVYDTISAPSFINCTISGNYGAQAMGGGGVLNSLSSPTFSSCKIVGNSAEAGAGVYNENLSSPAFSKCIISGNGADGRGGGMCNVNSSVKLTNCQVSNNYNYVLGGGFYNSYSTVSLINCTVTGNYANSGGGLLNESSTVNIYNSIVWGNNSNDYYEIGNQILNGSGTCELHYSSYANDTNDVTNYGTFIVDSNCITAEPKFVNFPDSDYRLLGNSPGVDAGNNYYNSESYDVRGQARIQNETIDMGAYEWTNIVDPFGELFTWTGACSSQWDNPGNWDVGNVPCNSDVVTIPNVINDPIISNPLNFSAICHDLTIEAGSILTVNSGSALTIIGTVNNENSPGNENLVVESGGSIITNSAAAASVKRYISGWSDSQHGWRLLSSPNQSQAISPAFANEKPTDYNFFQWDESSEIWLSQKEASNDILNFIPGEGYKVSYIESSTKQFDGHLNNTDIYISCLTNSLSNTVHGWHLLGNPFPCALRWNDGNWALLNMMGIAKLWNETDASYVDIMANDIIPSTNGFMVETSGDGSLVIPLLSRVHDTAHLFKDDAIITLTVRDSQFKTAQETVIRLNKNSNQYFDPATDSHFLAGYAPQFYSIKNSDKLSTYNILDFDEQEIHLGFVKNDAADFSIELKTLGVDYSQMIYLTDKKNGIITNLKYTPVYNFTSNDIDETDRFLLAFKDYTSVSKEEFANFKVYEEDGIVTILADPLISGRARITDLSGRTIANGSLIAGLPLHFNMNRIPGVYMVSVISKKQSFIQKIVMR